MGYKGLRVVLIVAIFASLGGVAYKVAENIWLMKAREIKKNPLKLLDYVPEAALQAKDFHRTHIEGGRKVWEVVGEEARFFKAEKEAVIKKPRLIFYQKSGETIEAKADEGHLFFSEKEMEKVQLQGGIQVSYHGFVLHTDEILYLKSKDQVVSPGKVTLKGEGLELEGVGMEIALQDQKIRLLQKVKSKFQPERLGNVRGRADGKKKNRS